MTTTNAPRTLAQRIAEGRIPIPEALHYAMSLAEALRKLHDAGKAHGAVSPASIALTGAGLELIPPVGPLAAVTSYTAPEVLQGQPADARSDIFSFGALVFEMLTGHKAFQGEGQTELTMALCNSAPPPSGSPAVDRLVAGCVAKSPAARWQRMQKILMELKLLTVAARRADAGPAPRAVSDTALHSEIQQLEERIAARLAAHERKISEAQLAAGGAVAALHEALAGFAGRLAALEDKPAAPTIDVEALQEQIQSRIHETVAALTGDLSANLHASVDAANRQHAVRVTEALEAAGTKHAAQAAHVAETVAAVNQRTAAAEQNLEEIRKHFATLQENVAGDLHDFEQALKTQSVAIESARTAMSQTDDLVERVVEALELLQSSLLDQHAGVGV